MANEPGWFPDPYGRYQQRYHDGTKWTEHVATGDQQLVDPMGTSLAIPFAMPASATSGDSGNLTGDPTGDDPSGEPSSGNPSSGNPLSEAAESSGSDRPSGPTGAQSLAHPHSPAAQATAPLPETPTTGQPGTPAAGGADTGRSGWRGLLDGFGPDARERPRPDVTVALAGIGGAMAALGVLLLAVDVRTLDDLSNVRTKEAIFSVVVLAIAYAIRLFVTGQRELRSAAVGAGAVGIVGIGAAIAAGSDSQTGALLVVAVLFIAAWLLPGLRGRPLILGLAGLSLVGVVASLAVDDRISGVGVGIGRTSDSGQGIAFLLSGAVLLGLVFVLDREGFHGVATSLLVAGLIATVVGAIQVVGNLNSAGGSLLLALVGIAICIVGTHGNRRASVWIGAAMAGIGAIAFVVALVKPGSVGGTSGALIGAAAVLIGGPLVFEMIRSNRGASGAMAGQSPSSNLPPPAV